jgi:hypothetical protein
VAKDFYHNHYMLPVMDAHTYEAVSHGYKFSGSVKVKNSQAQSTYTPREIFSAYNFTKKLNLG